MDSPPEETSIQPVGLDDPSPGHQPQGVAAHGMASSRQVRHVYPEFFTPPVPHSFLEHGNRVAREFRGGVPYSGEGETWRQLCRGISGRLRLEWVAGLVCNTYTSAKLPELLQFCCQAVSEMVRTGSESEHPTYMGFWARPIDRSRMVICLRSCRLASPS